MNFNRRAARFSDWCRIHLLPRHMAAHWFRYRLRRLRDFYWPAFLRTPSEERKSWIAILGDLVALRWRLIVYLHYGLYLRGIERSVFEDYLDESWFYYGICFGLGRNHMLLDDKVLFNHVCSSTGLPVPRLLLYTKDGTVRAANSSILTTDSEVQRVLSNSGAALIQKPSVCSSGGNGILRYVQRADRIYYSCVGPLHYESLATVRDEDILIQEEVRNHEAFSALGSDSLLCLRIMSVFGAAGVEIPCGLLKVSVSEQLADNGGVGGIYVAVDMNTGRLAACGTNERLEQFEMSPMSGVRFREFVVPHFDEILSTIKQAASVFSDLPVVGWDIAVTGSGPVIVEGNSSPSLAMVMKSHQGAAQLRDALEKLL